MGPGARKRDTHSHDGFVADSAGRNLFTTAWSGTRRRAPERSGPSPPSVPTMTRIAAALICLCTLAGCGGDGPTTPTLPTAPTPLPPPQAPTATVFGLVQDAESGAGIEGATVIVEDQWARFAEVGRSVTAADGKYLITGITLAAGPEGGASLTIRAFAHGYVSGVEGWGTRARSPGGHNLDFNLEPAPTCTVVGSVRDQAGRGVAGASVQACASRIPNSLAEP